MKFNTYSEYVSAAMSHFGSKTNLKVPPEYMILSEEMFNLFNGSINFGTGEEPTDSKGGCQNGRCKCGEKDVNSDCGGKNCGNCDCDSCGGH